MTTQPKCSHATGALRFDEPNENVRQRSANERRSVSESVDNPVVAGANGAALPAHEHGKNANSRMLLLALILNGTFLIVEVIGRSEERPVGKECVRTGRSRWSPEQ